MNPKTIEQIRAAFLAIHHVATGKSDRAYMSIPADRDRDADLIVSAAIDELAELRALNAQLAAQVDDARRQYDECATTLALLHGGAVEPVATSEPTPLEAAVTAHTEHACHGDCLTAADVGVSLPGNPIAYAHPECRLHNPPAHTEHVAVVVERSTTQPHVLSVRTVDDELHVSTDEAAALVTALLADGAVHAKWLHGRGGR